MGSAGNPLTVARSRIAVRRHLAATPGRLRLAMALLALSAIVFGVVAAHAAGERRRAVGSVAATERLRSAGWDRLAAVSGQACAGLRVGWSSRSAVRAFSSARGSRVGG
jgi:hypothetical protein